MTNKNIIKNPHILNISIEEEQYEKIRKMAYISRKSLAQVIRDMIDNWNIDKRNEKCQKD